MKISVVATIPLSVREPGCIVIVLFLTATLKLPLVHYSVFSLNRFGALPCRFSVYILNTSQCNEIRMKVAPKAVHQESGTHLPLTHLLRFYRFSLGDSTSGRLYVFLFGCATVRFVSAFA